MVAQESYTMLFLLRIVAILTLAGAIAAQSHAQPFPVRQVRLIVPFPPGGPTDAFARLLANRLQETWKQSVIVESKPGAGTVVGTDFVVRSAPDGHTLGMDPVGSTPEQFDAFVRREIEKWAPVVKTTGATAD